MQDKRNADLQFFSQRQPRTTPMTHHSQRRPVAAIAPSLHPGNVAAPALAALALAAAMALSGCGRYDSAAAAREFVAKGDDASAAVSLRNAVRDAPQSVELRVLLADAMERRQDRLGAEQHLRKAVEIGADANLLAPRIALMMVDRGDMETAIRSYKDTALQDPAADAALRGTVALAMLSLKRDALARRHIEGLPPVPEVRLARAQLLVGEGKAVQALALLDLDNPSAPPPWWMLRAGRRIAMAAGQADRSLLLIKRAQEAIPWHLGVVGEYGEALISANRIDEATLVRDRLRKQAPQFFWTYYLEALLHNHAGRIDQAHAAALAVLKVSPDHVGSALIAASAELQRGDLLVADKRLGALLRKNADSVPALRLQAQAQSRLGQPQDAGDTLRRGLRMAPNDPELLSLRAKMETSAGRMKDAAHTLTLLVAQQPDDPDALLALAQARGVLGDSAGARQWLEKAAALANDSTMGARVVDGALSLGAVEWARRIADQLVARAPKDEQARLALAAVQSAQGDAAGSWATTLAVLDDKPTNGGAISALAAMSRSPAQRKELMARHARALEAGGAGTGQLLDYATLLRFEPVAGTSPLTVMDKAVQLYPQSAQARSALVDELMRSGSSDRAITVAQTGATMVNPAPGAAELLAETYARVGKPGQAAEIYRKLSSEFPQRGELRYKLARLEAQNGRTAEATTLLRGLVSERPFDMAPYVVLAEIAARSNMTEALSVARQMGEQPDLKNASLLLAGDLLRGGHAYDDALVQFIAARKAGALPAANLRLVGLYEQLGRTQAADQELADTLRRFPDHPSVVGAAAARAQARGDAASAAHLLQGLLAKAPNNPVLLNDLAWAQLAAGRSEALGNARRALAILPNDPNVLHTMGLALAKSGKRDDAIASLRAATNLAPTAAMPRLHLAENLVAAGDKPGAAQALRGIDEAQLGNKDKSSLRLLKSTLGMS